MQAIREILCYLKSIPEKGLLFKSGQKLEVRGYTNADYSGSLVDRKSTIGYCVFLGENLVSWRSKKQVVLARSSAKAKFRPMALGLCELLWLKIVLSDFKILGHYPMKLMCDNQSAINIVHNSVQHDYTKHVEIDSHFTKEKLGVGEICLSFVPSENQLADLLTKGLPLRRFKELVSKLRMIDIHLPA